MNTEPQNPAQTPRQQFESMAKRVVSVPKKEVDALQAEWKKTKHKRGTKAAS